MNHLLLSLFFLVATFLVPGGQASKFLKSQYEEHLDVGLKLVLDEHSQSRINLDRLTALNESLTPVIFWHGMGDTAYGSINIERMALQRKYPNLSVFSIQIGKNTIEDDLGSYFVNVNYQVNMACKAILNNEIIRRHGSFNAVGFSQGCQFLRGLIQRCPLRENGIEVKNFISLGGQHQGVFGLPNCFFNTFCDYIRQLLTEAAYEKNIQEHLVQAEYWHDPNQEEEYKSKSVYLADINNENYINETYKNNLLALHNFVLVEFLNDDKVIPRESSLFGYYAPGEIEKIVPLEMSAMYLEDRIGLRQLHKTGRLHMISIPGKHLQYNMTWFIKKIASVYLIN